MQMEVNGLAGDLVSLSLTYYKAGVWVARIAFVVKFFPTSARTPVPSNDIVANAVRRTWIVVAFVDICSESAKSDIRILYVYKIKGLSVYIQGVHDWFAYKANQLLSHSKLLEFYDHPK